jgi:hypothetical protein
VGRVVVAVKGATTGPSAEGEVTYSEPARIRYGQTPARSAVQLSQATDIGPDCYLPCAR